MRRKRAAPPGSRERRDRIARVERIRRRERKVLEAPPSERWAHNGDSIRNPAPWRRVVVGTRRVQRVWRSTTADGDHAARYLRDSNNPRGPGSAYFRPRSLRPGYLSGQNGDYPNDWHCRVLTKAPIFRPDNRPRSRELRQAAPTAIPHRGRSTASHLRHRETHLYIVNVVEIRVLHFFDVTLRNLTGKSVNTTVGGAVVVPETTCANDGVANDESRLVHFVILALSSDYRAREYSTDAMRTQNGSQRDEGISRCSYLSLYRIFPRSLCIQLEQRKMLTLISLIARYASCTCVES